MATDVAELDIRLDVVALNEGNGPWKVRLTVLSGPDFRFPHAHLGGIWPTKEAAERVGYAVVEALQAKPPRLEGDRVIVDVPELAVVGEVDAYPVF